MSFKKILTNIISKFLPTRIFFYFCSIFNTVQFNKEILIEIKGLSFKFINPNHITNWRLSTFETKEPETLDWIDNFSDKSIFWDIGANIGQYTLYAAKKIKNIKVYSFEPSVFNLEILARNIYINKLDNISIITNPISKNINNDYFSLTNTDWGGALSNFSTTLNWEGNDMSVKLRYKTFSLDIKTLVENFKVELPNYLKIDVDGNDHIILESFGDYIKHVDQVLIEVNDNYIEQKTNIEKFLSLNNFQLLKKEQSDLIKKFPKSFHQSYNQIWINNEKNR